jgi:DNA uptake protein ComE-like DNA-binding protein
MTSPGGINRLPAPRQPARGRGRQILWASVPVWSIGFLSPVPFLAYAVITRTRRDWAVFAGYLAATVAMIIALSATKEGTAPNDAVGLFIVALAGCAAAHAAVLFRPSRGVTAGAAPGSLSTRQRNQAALAAARDKLERRKEARHLAATNPALARDLKIGRPDLPRDYDDGGLVDVNHVPVEGFSSGLGLTPIEARDVVAARDKLGRFVSPEELCEYTQLSPDRVDELRDLMIFT